MGFVALYLAGERDAKRDPVLAKITEVNFDESKRAKLQDDSDLDKVLRQLLNSV